MPIETLRHVFLVGFMGSGKTSVGQELARRKSWEFIDLDQVIERSAGQSIPEIFHDQGEPEFRRIETAALKDLLASSSDKTRVVALGGGAFVHSGNAAAIAQAPGRVIFLDAPVAELLRRCRQQRSLERPLTQDETGFCRLYEQRRPQYLAGTLRVDTNEHTIEQVVDEIECHLAMNRREHGWNEG